MKNQPNRRASPAPSSPALRWLRAVLVLGILIGITIFAVRKTAPRVADLSPEQVEEKMDEEAWPIEEAIVQVNRLDGAARRRVMTGPQAQRYFQKLDNDQRLKFVKETMDRGIREQIEGYRKMTPEQRDSFVDQIRRQQDEQRERIKSLSDAEKKKMKEMFESGEFTEAIERAMKSYLGVTTSAERAELAPLFDAALENLQFARSAQ